MNYGKVKRSDVKVTVSNIEQNLSRQMATQRSRHTGTLNKFSLIKFYLSFRTVAESLWLHVENAQGFTLSQHIFSLNYESVSGGVDGSSY